MHCKVKLNKLASNAYFLIQNLNKPKDKLRPLA